MRGPGQIAELAVARAAGRRRDHERRARAPRAARHASRPIAAAKAELLEALPSRRRAVLRAASRCSSRTCATDRCAATLRRGGRRRRAHRWPLRRPRRHDGVVLDVDGRTIAVDTHLTGRRTTASTSRPRWPRAARSASPLERRPRAPAPIELLALARRGAPAAGRRRARQRRLQRQPLLDGGGAGERWPSAPATARAGRGAGRDGRAGRRRRRRCTGGSARRSRRPGSTCWSRSATARGLPGGRRRGSRGRLGRRPAAEAAAALAGVAAPGDGVLVKASRSVGLEAVAAGDRRAPGELARDVTRDARSSRARRPAPCSHRASCARRCASARTSARSGPEHHKTKQGTPTMGGAPDRGRRRPLAFLLFTELQRPRASRCSRHCSAAPAIGFADDWRRSSASARSASRALRSCWADGAVRGADRARRAPTRASRPQVYRAARRLPRRPRLGAGTCSSS